MNIVSLFFAYLSQLVMRTFNQRQKLVLSFKQMRLMDKSLIRTRIHYIQWNLVSQQLKSHRNTSPHYTVYIARMGNVTKCGEMFYLFSSSTKAFGSIIYGSIEHTLGCTGIIVRTHTCNSQPLCMPLAKDSGA